jgi:CBS domain-containing protein
MELAMQRYLYSYRYVSGDPALLENTLVKRNAELLRAATDTAEDNPAADGTFSIELDADIAGLHIAKRVRVFTGVAARDGHRTKLPIRWQADPARHLFPRFDGALEWEALDSNLGQLTLAGTYDMPMGLIGGAANATVLRDVAHRTTENLLQALAFELEAFAVTSPEPERLMGPQGGALRVRDVMTPNPVVLDDTLPLRTAALILFHAEVSGAPVVHSDGSLVGVLSESNLLVKEAVERFDLNLTKPARDPHRDARTVREVCTTPARVTAPDALLAEAARELLDHDIARLVVVGEGRIVGVITRHDVLAALIRDDRSLCAEVRRRLDTHGIDTLVTHVEWGDVTLSGAVRLRSVAASAVPIAESVDGVMTVDGSLIRWEVDDVLPVAQFPIA